MTRPRFEEIIPARTLRPYLIDTLQNDLARAGQVGK